MKNTSFYIKSQKVGTMIEDALIAAHIKYLSIKSQKGVTMIEYSLIAGLVAVVTIAGFTSIGTNMKTLLPLIAAKIPTTIP